MKDYLGIAANPLFIPVADEKNERLTHYKVGAELIILMAHASHRFSYSNKNDLDMISEATMTDFRFFASTDDMRALASKLVEIADDIETKVKNLKDDVFEATGRLVDGQKAG